MRASLEWLRQYVQLPPSVTVDQIADMLVRLGHELDGVHTPPAIVGDLVVGQVQVIEELVEFKKPIRFVTLDVGSGHGVGGGHQRQVICGATNFAVQDKVAVALPGAVLPGDFAIASRATYGRVSDGMICSASELRVGEDPNGILVLDQDAPVGVDARPLVGATDTVFELEITPDRGYALSIRGLARELAAGFDAPFADVAAAPIRDVTDQPPPWPVTILDPTGCDRFVVVRVAGVNPGARAPFWMRRRLLAGGIRSISLAVDITNYLMIEFGQPLHAFDTSTVRGPISVRRAVAGEQLQTLDGVTRTLADTDLVVADASAAISLAGVMGGASTEIDTGTTDVLIEAAHWTPSVIGRTARQRGLISEASRRFERAVDPAIAAAAAERAAQLLVRFGGGAIVPGRTDVGFPIPLSSVDLPLDEPQRIIGRPVTPAVAGHRLSQVGCRVEPRPGHLHVVPPSWRPDLIRPADLVEEIIRLEGYDTIGSEIPRALPNVGIPPADRTRRLVAADLAAVGLTEVLTFPFLGQRDLDALGLPTDDIRRRTARLLNPLDTARPSMRTTLLPGLLETVGRNLSRGAKDLGLFEIGLVFLPRPDAPHPPTPSLQKRPTDAELAVLDASIPTQVLHVGAVLSGNVERSGWWGGGRPADWADAIELARRIGRSGGVDVRIVSSDNPPWHPGRCASVRVGDWPVGYAGELHPAVIERLGLPPRTVALEVNLSGFPTRRMVSPPTVSSYPPVLMDVALTVDEAVAAEDVTAALRRGGGALLESVRLFDVYTGSSIPEGKKSLAFALIVRSFDQTLTSAQAQQIRDAAVRATEVLGAEMR